MAFKRLQAGRNLVQKTGTDKIFGLGSDGTVIVSTSTSLSRDMYYDNLTVNENVILFTNGFKVFVKNNLINNGTIGMPSGTAQTTTALTGTVMTRIDGNAGYISADATSGSLTLAEVKNFDSLMTGVIQKGSDPRRWFAGAVGSSGTSGTANAGAGGGAGSGTAGTGGAAGLAGGAVVVLAKSISGSGVFVSQGTAGVSGNAGSSGANVSGNSAHNPGGHAHNPGGHAHNPGGHAHNPPGHNPPGSFTHGEHFTPGNPFGNVGKHNPNHHNPSHHHSNPGTEHPGNQFAHPGNQFAHPGNQFSHPGNPFHNPSYAGGTGNPGNPGNPGTQGTLSIVTRSISTHVAESANLTYVEDLDD